MKPTGTHPERKAMIKAIKEGRVPFKAHLKQCSPCREMFEALEQFPLASREPLVQPSPDALDRYSAIPLVDRRPVAARRIEGRVSFDSWADCPAAQLRDMTVGMIRRICLKAGKLSLEIVAERRQDCWEFVGRVYDRKNVSSEYVLRVGARKLLPRSQGFYHWSSKGTPRTFKLLSQDLQVEFERLSWR